MSLFISSVCRAGLGSDLRKRLSAGRVSLDGARSARQLAAETRSEDGTPAEVAAGDLLAVELLADAYRILVQKFLSRVDDTLLDRLMTALEDRLGGESIQGLLVDFRQEYLGIVEDMKLRLEAGEAMSAGGRVGHGEALLDLVVFWLLESNPAVRPIVRHLHSSPMLGTQVYRSMVQAMDETLDQEPGFDEAGESLLDILLQPARQSPDSLTGQLQWIRSAWRPWVDDFGRRVEPVLDLIAEEQRPFFPPGPGPAELPVFQDDGEPSYSLDRSWMGGLVLIAKHTLVWLHQLQSQYGRPIERLDEIPDEELERLSSLGFNGLWLIGIWERSPASRTIKRTCGNPEAVASAYSLSGYRVANELGGEEALANLRHRAATAGIRLAADMVPNHTGIDSDLVMERPEWFIGQQDSPFPSYEFEGPDLSPRSDIGLFLENHYYDRSDAAVVFERIDRSTGQTRYIYHGNDGTSTPWNDTAQLDYLNAEVREAVIETILEVARRVPIIRFDAAMTLTRKHFQRLWFPAPGTAGAIPSRAEHSMSREQFEQMMPVEFWREVVDRVAEEAPDTLLLAEAFWLLEGYFVRSLGMHRVYNSAFMNMLRDGETAKYRQLIKDTLEFDPQILNRFVNFMNNPDERSAVDQFGRGDRYFGTCALMSTLPGLPMFGHGQVEGLAERYGMEYGREYSQEQPDAEMIRRHEEQIVPLLRRRELFAGVEKFRFYDVMAAGGDVLEDVIAFSNALGSERVVFLFNNSPNSAHGRIHRSTPQLGLKSGTQETTTLGEALIQSSREGFLRYRDRASQREFLIDTESLARQGLEVDLRGLEFRVLMDFEAMTIEPAEGLALSAFIGTRGAPDLDQARIDLAFETVKTALEAALEPRVIGPLLDLPRDSAGLGSDDQLLDRLTQATSTLLGAVADWTGRRTSENLEETIGHRRFLALVTVPELASRLEASKKKGHHEAGEGLAEALDRHPETLPALFGWILLSSIADALSESGREVEEWLDRQPEIKVMNGLLAAGGAPKSIGRLTSGLGLTLRQDWGRSQREPPEATALIAELLEDESVLEVLGVHELRGHAYLSEDALRTLIDWRLLVETLACSAGETDTGSLPQAIEGWWDVLSSVFSEAEAASFRLDVLRGAVGLVDETGDQERPAVEGEKRTTTSE